jgi:hypothetical protein
VAVLLTVKVHPALIEPPEMVHDTLAVKPAGELEKVPVVSEGLNPLPDTLATVARGPEDGARVIVGVIAVTVNTLETDPCSTSEPVIVIVCGPGFAVLATVILPARIPDAEMLQETAPEVKGSLGLKLNSGAQFATAAVYPDPDRVTDVVLGPLVGDTPNDEITTKNAELVSP